MKKLSCVAIVIALVVSTSVNAQVSGPQPAVSKTKTIDLNDTTAPNQADVNAAKALLKKFGSVSASAYGADIKSDLDASSTVEVWELHNVKSRVKDGSTTQYIVKFKLGGKEQVIITSEDPTDKLTAAIDGSSGCNCFSVKQGDDDGSDVDPDLMK